MRTVDVTITQEDAKSGVFLDNHGCPLAIALDRYPEVGATWIGGFYLEGKDGRWTIPHDEWNYTIHQSLRKGEIESVTIQLVKE